MRVIDFKDANCKNCYKCVRNCELKAITVQNEQARIMADRCINCGTCLSVCPQNAKTFSSDLDRVKGYLKQGMKTVVSLSPAYLGVFDYEKPGQVVHALQKLGFTYVRETAEGATLVTKEYQRLLKEGKMENIIATACPSMNTMIEKYYPSLVPYMAPVISPIIAHGRLLRKLYGEEVKIIYLGTCIAAKEEALGDARVRGAIDAILTFEEVMNWWKMENIHLEECENRPFENPDPGINRLYGISGGIVKAVEDKEEEDDYQKIAVDGVKACKELFRELEKGKIKHGFFEVHACQGGCVRGPVSGKSGVSHAVAVLKMKNASDCLNIEAEGTLPEIEMNKFFEDRKVTEKFPNERELTRILRGMGKYKKEDELNCGACGYPSCRAKAIAVYQGKAEQSMCLPYAVSKASSMANFVMESIPTMIIVVDRELRICEFNQCAQDTFKISRDEALQMYIFEIMDEEDVQEVFDTGKSMFRKKVNLEAEQISVMESIVYVEERDLALIVFKDITEEEQAREQHYNLKIETVEMAQRVIDKQMMVAQEIAGLLGETTAETKVTLSKLRDSILFEEDE